MMATAHEYVDLPCGSKMPSIGLGTWQADGDSLRNAIQVALDCGYRMFDTAVHFGNEKIIGEVLNEKFKSGQLKREDIFLSTKLHPIYMDSKQATRKGLERSLTNLGFSYVDLFLIYFPVGMKLQEDESFTPVGADGKIIAENCDIIETWKGLEDLVDEGLTKAIGLCNFNSKQILRIKTGARQPISNIQVEIHTYFQQKELVNFCNLQGIPITAYAPLGSPGRWKVPDMTPHHEPFLDHPALRKIAKKYRKTPTQVMLRNLKQRGICVIPKSVTPVRIKQNSQLTDFQLSENDMKAITKLDQNMRLFNLRSYGEDLPEYPFRGAF